VVKIVVSIEANQHIIVDWLAVFRILEDQGSCLLLELPYYVLNAFLQFVQVVVGDSRPNLKNVMIPSFHRSQDSSVGMATG
jgi:hypothetical protein